MNKLKNFLTIIFIFILIYIIFRFNIIINTSVITAVNLFLKNVFPSLFIMIILNDIIINTNVLHHISHVLSPIFNKVFNTTGISVEAFLLAMLSGTPTSAFIIKELLDNKKISLEDANKLISFTYFSNPLFLYNILSLSFNSYITLKIIIIHYITNIFIGLIMRNKKSATRYKYIVNNNSKNIFVLMPESIKKSMNTLLMILGTITFYMIITNLVINIFNITGILEIILKGFLEITQSLNILPLLSIKSNIKEIIAISIISFGGLSIHTQVLALISETKISYKNFLIGRILHTILGALTYFIIKIIIS